MNPSYQLHNHHSSASCPLLLGLAHVLLIGVIASPVSLPIHSAYDSSCDPTHTSESIALLLNILSQCLNAFKVNTKTFNRPCLPHCNPLTLYSQGLSLSVYHWTGPALFRLLHLHLDCCRCISLSSSWVKSSSSSCLWLINFSSDTFDQGCPLSSISPSLYNYLFSKSGSTRAGIISIVLIVKLPVQCLENNNSLMNMRGPQKVHRIISCWYVFKDKLILIQKIKIYAHFCIIFIFMNVLKTPHLFWVNQWLNKTDMYGSLGIFSKLSIN